ncbi:MAG TPA: hypothetical protein VFR50_01110 [Casimicrobiaceae bacterium]|nr:hypothetical protein [Casimicrobiaceae bacterium]
MASCTPDNRTGGAAPAPAATAAQPRTVALASIAEQIAAIDELIGLAQHRIRVFDQDLSEMGWNRAPRIDRLGAFLRGMRSRRLDIIVHDTSYLESSCPRLLALLRNYSCAVAICRTGPEARHAADPLLLVDDRHYLHRFHFEQPRATMGTDQPEDTRPLAQRYDEIWATGEPGVNPTVLGL